LADECMFPVVYVPAESMITYIIQTKYLNYNFYLFIWRCFTILHKARNIRPL